MFLLLSAATVNEYTSSAEIRTPNVAAVWSAHLTKLCGPGRPARGELLSFLQLVNCLTIDGSISTPATVEHCEKLCNYASVVTSGGDCRESSF